MVSESSERCDVGACTDGLDRVSERCSRRIFGPGRQPCDAASEIVGVLALAVDAPFRHLQWRSWGAIGWRGGNGPQEIPCIHTNLAAGPGSP